jgi:hypothetical protein
MYPKFTASPTSPFLPTIPWIGSIFAASAGLSPPHDICLEMFRRQLTDEKTRRRLHRLDQRLLKVVAQLENLNEPEK